MDSTSEFYTDDTEVPDFDKLNKEIRDKMFADIDFEGKNKEKLSEKEFNININKILKPDIHFENKEYFSTEDEYIPKTTDPYKRLAELKRELFENYAEINMAASKFKDLSFVNSNKDKYTSLFTYLNNNKQKIDAFINYDLFNRIDESDQSSDEDEEENLNESKSQKSEKSEEGSKKEEDDENKEKVYSIFERYSRITNNLLSQIKQFENDLTEGKETINTKVNYKVISNPITEMETLTSRVGDLEDLINSLEKTIGNWEVFKIHESISMTVSNLISFISSKGVEKYDARYSVFKAFGYMITNFVDKNMDDIEIGHIYAKIKEIYLVYEMKEQFADCLEYMKRRLQVIQNVCYSSDQFNASVYELDKLIHNNESQMKVLTDKYKDTLEAFEGLDKILNELKEIDNKIKSKI